MIAFLDLKTQYLSIREELEAAVLRALASTQYALGSEVAAFEEEFAAFCGVESAVAMNSGTSALHVALLAAGVERGDEVITVASTFVATVAAIDYVGARPVFVDVEPGTLNLDAGKITASVTEKTKAIVPVHLHGHPSDMDLIFDSLGRGQRRTGGTCKGRRTVTQVSVILHLTQLCRGVTIHVWNP